MKLRLPMALASAALFLILAPNPAGALDSPPDEAMPGRTLMQNANESAQATTDMSYGEAGRPPVRNVSYGGVATNTTEAGGRQERPCPSGPQCRIYFGQ
jgi:hypothetical protein